MKALGSAVFLACCLLASSALAAPRLALVVVVDQLRRDRLDPALPGGLGRLAREGRVFARGALAHAATETCPGHAVVSTGRHPGAAGMPANQFVDRESGAVRYCVQDDPQTAAVIGREDVAIGRSPRQLRVEAMGDWMKAADPASLVFSVSAKDRSAIALGGLHPDGVYWLLRSGAVGFSTSRYYASALPGWVRDFNGLDPARDGLFAAIPERWVHRDGLRVPRGRPDDYPHELDVYSRTSGHPLRDTDASVFADRVYRSPFADDVTLAFARALVREEGLGTDPVPDVLAIGLSATDPVGHAYGPESHEAADALLRLDHALGAFLEWLEAEIGADGFVVALTSDHGVLPIPEWLEETGRGTCPIADGRLGLDGLRSGLFWHLHFALGPWYAWPRDWLFHAGTQATVDRALARERGVAPARVVATAEAWLEAQPGIEEVWTAEEIASRPGEHADLYRASFDAERSGDLAIETAAGCLLSLYDTGTSHGAPYAYDRDVPIVFWGPGVVSGVSQAPAATVDVAPTLMRTLGLAPPAGLDGRVLELSR